MGTIPGAIKRNGSNRRPIRSDGYREASLMDISFLLSYLESGLPSYLPVPFAESSEFQGEA